VLVLHELSGGGISAGRLSAIRNAGQLASG